MNKKEGRPSFVKFYLRKNGFSLVEVMVVVLLITILMSIGVASFARSTQKDSLTLATHKVAVLLHQTRALAISENQMCALILHDDPTSSEYYQRRLTIASFQKGEGEDHVNPLEDPFILNHKWINLPEQVIIDAAYLNPLEPNAFSADLQNESQLALMKTATPSGSAHERHPLVRGIIFDRHGALLAYKNEKWVQYVNHMEGVTHHGCYITLRTIENGESRNTAGRAESDHLSIRRLYLSPFTGNVQTL